MNVNKVNNISFNAKYISSFKVGKFNQNQNCYSEEDVSFVETDDNNVNDLRAIRKISKDWQNSYYVENYYNTAFEKYMQNINYKNIKLYVLTLQNADFNYLDDTKILGVAEVAKLNEDNAMFYIKHFEAKNRTAYSANPEYIGVGSRILDGLKELAQRIDLISRYNYSVQKFYRKNGFYEIPEGSNHYVWIKEKDVFDKL